jgi:hypothetical protein
MRKGMIYLGLLQLMLFLVPANAFAYLDPGTGTAILQGILAALGAALVALKLYWHRILQLFGLRQATTLEKKKYDSGQQQ